MKLPPWTSFGKLPVGFPCREAGMNKQRKAEYYQKFAKHLPKTAEAVRRRVLRKALHFPQILSVELTNRCNAACIMCPRQFMTRPKGIMDVDVYRKILREASHYQHHLRLFQPFLFGEALLHPEFGELIRETREWLPQTRIYLSTNAGLLRTEHIEAILDAKLDKVNIDIDGTTKEVAEKIRRHVNYDQVLENVEKFLVERNRRKSHTKMRVSIVRMAENSHQIDEFKRLWNTKAGHIQVVDYNSWLGYLDQSGQQFELPSIPFDFSCRHPYEELAIAWDGRTSLCCLDFNLLHMVGDLRNNSIREIWRDAAMNDARNKLEHGKYDSLPICHRCNAAKFQQDNLWRFLWNPGALVRFNEE